MNEQQRWTTNNDWYILNHILVVHVLFFCFGFVCLFFLILWYMKYIFFLCLRPQKIISFFLVGRGLVFVLFYTIFWFLYLTFLLLLGIPESSKWGFASICCNLHSHWVQVTSVTGVIPWNLWSLQIIHIYTYLCMCRCLCCIGKLPS